MSTGPRSPEGKRRVSQNALKHGLTARTHVLPGEDPEAFKGRAADWWDELEPNGALAGYLLDRLVGCSWQLDRADRAMTAHLTRRIHCGGDDRDLAEAEQVEDLVRHLLWDPRGPINLYPHFRGLRATPRISGGEALDDPIQPARIVRALKATYTGCRWLVDRWTELRRLLDDGLNWQAPDRFRAVRMLGHQPLDVLSDESVLAIYLACDAMDPAAPTSLDDLRTETEDIELTRLKERVRGRGADARRPADPAAGRASLVALIDEVLAGLSVRLGVHRERRQLEAAMHRDLLAFDDSPTGELMRRYRLAAGREFFRALSSFQKAQKEAGLEDHDAETIGDAPLSPAQPIDGSSDLTMGPSIHDVVVASPDRVPDATPDDPAGCAEMTSDPTILHRPAVDRISVDETKPNRPEEPVDETKPNRSEEPVDETKPNPPGPVPSGVGSGRPDRWLPGGPDDPNPIYELLRMALDVTPESRAPVLGSPPAGTEERPPTSEGRPPARTSPE